MTYKLANLLKARFPLIYITTFEEDWVTRYIRNIVSDEKEIKSAKDELQRIEDDLEKKKEEEEKLTNILQETQNNIAEKEVKSTIIYKIFWKI